MLQLQLKEAFLNRGITPTPYLLSKLGISNSIAKQYLSGSAKILKLSHLYNICKYLNCTPKELIKVEPKNATIVQGTPLQDWVDALPKLDVDSFRTLTPAQLQKAAEMLKQIASE